MILFQTKNFCGNIKATTLARYFINVTSQVFDKPKHGHIYIKYIMIIFHVISLIHEIVRQQ